MDWYMGNSPEGYSDWLAWKAGEVDESNPMENPEDWEWNDALELWERN